MGNPHGQVTELLEHLLVRDGYVSLNEVGGFVTRTVPARLDPTTGKLLPPRKEAAYNSAIKNDDGVLASMIAQKQGCSHHEARKTVRDYISDIQKALLKEGSYTFSGIGKLARNEAGNYHFSPSSDTSEAFTQGLPALTLHKIRSFPKRAEPVSKKRKNKSKTLVWLIPLLILGAGAMIFFGQTDTGKQLGNIISSISLPEKKVATQKELSRDSAPEVLNGLSQTIIGGTIPETANGADEISATKHYIIGGSFQDKENAESLAKSLRASGFEGIVLEADRGFYRVAFSSFSNKVQANQELIQIKTNQNPEAWVLTQ